MQNAPQRYDERFWYGNDKTGQCFETAQAGFQFWVLPESVGWLEHWEHPAEAGPKLAKTRDDIMTFAQLVQRSQCWHQLVNNKSMACADLSARQNPFWVSYM